MAYERRGSYVGLMSGLLALILLLVIGVSVAAYAMGWMTIQNEPDRTTIEVDTDKFRDAAAEVNKQGEDLLEKSGDVLRDAGDALKNSADEDSE
jgi:hypothetical protein